MPSLKPLLLILSLGSFIVPAYAANTLSCSDVRPILDSMLPNPLTKVNSTPTPATIIAKLGIPQRQVNSGYIYRWEKDGYTLSIILNKVFSDRTAHVEIISPTKQRLSSVQNNPGIPHEFIQIWNMGSGNNALFTAENLLGFNNMQKIKLTTYVWQCIYNPLIVNGQAIQSPSLVEVTFDEDDHYVGASY